MKNKREQWRKWYNELIEILTRGAIISELTERKRERERWEHEALFWCRNLSDLCNVNWEEEEKRRLSWVSKIGHHLFHHHLKKCLHWKCSIQVRLQWVSEVCAHWCLSHASPELSYGCLWWDCRDNLKHELRAETFTLSTTLKVFRVYLCWWVSLVSASVLKSSSAVNVMPILWTSSLSWISLWGKNE